MKSFTQYFKIAAFAAAAMLGAPAQAEQYALMVSIEDYSRVGANSLPGCSTDLKNLRQVLESDFGFPAANITVLQEGQATKAKVLGSLDQLIAKAKPGDSVVFYYTGHGGQVPDMNDDDETSDNLDEALITSDFNPKDPDTWLLDDHLRASLSRLKTRRALVLIDACNSGTGTRGAGIINKRAKFGFETMLGRGRIDTHAIETSSKSGGPASHVLISGCAADELSAMGSYDGVMRSLYTTALIRVLPRMKSASLADLTNAIHDEMKKIHPEAANDQTPQLETALEVNLTVLIGQGGAANPSAPVNQPNDEAPVQSPGDGLPSAFKVVVATDKREFMPGETMVATVVSEKAGHLRLYYVDKHGDATLIFPNHYQRDNQIKGKQRVEVGGPDAKFLFRMQKPGGTEILLAAVSPEKFSDHDTFDFSKENPFHKIGKVKSLRQLVDRGTKQIVIEGRPGNDANQEGGSPIRPVQIGRAGCIYEIRID